MKVLFVTLASNTLGFGHLRRCLSLAEYLSKNNQSTSFYLLGDHNSVQAIKNAGYECYLGSIAAADGEIDLSSFGRSTPFDIIVVDLPFFSWGHTDHISNLLRSIRSCENRIVLIDGLGDQAIANKIPDLPIDILVSPYVGPSVPKNNNWCTLEGADYAILSSAYASLPERSIRKTANRVLVSCGGSDPKELTTKVLHGLERIGMRLTLRVIIGPLFDSEHKLAIKRLASGSKHSIELIDAPDELVAHMLWCDVAVSTSSLIKYELAATGTPAILMSIDKTHDAVNLPFSNLGCTVDLGVETTFQEIAGQVSKLLKDHQLRERMARVGNTITDGRGTERLMTAIMEGDCVTTSI